MSNKGVKHSPETKLLISDKKKKLSIPQLIQFSNEYINQLTINPKLLPTISGLAIYLKVNRTYLYELASNNPELADIMETIELLQEEYCLTRGITNQANPIFSMFLLKSKHNFRDQPTNQVQNNYMNISPEVLQDALKLMEENKTPGK